MTPRTASRFGFLHATSVGARCMRRHPAVAAAFLVAVVAQGFLQGFLIWTIKNVLVSLSSGASARETTIVGAVLIFVIWLFRAATVLAADSLSIRLATLVEHGAMFDVLERLVRLPIAFFDRHSQGDLVMSSYHDLKSLRACTVEVGRLVLYASQVAGLAVAAVMMSPSLAIMGMLTVPLGAIPAYQFGRRITRSAESERHAITTLHDSFLQIAAGIRAIRVNRLEQRLVERARLIGHELRVHMVHMADQRGLARFLLESVSGIGLILILTLGAHDVAEGHMEWPTLMGLLVAVIAVYQPVVNVLHTYGTLRSVLPNLERVERIMAAKEESSPADRSVRLLTPPSTIELRDVSFCYDGPPVLEGVSATFYRGETIGIVGPSGAGKSTLMALLLGFYEPTKGTVLYDGTDLRRIVRADLMDLSAIVLQEPFLFGATIAENIRAGRFHATMEEVVGAAAAAQLHDEILRMEERYETVLGRGTAARGVSVGQKQRIAIAAALLKNPPLLFLDEATSNLDTAAENRVQAAIARVMAGRTTFVIAHRFSTLIHADRILVLEQGRVVDFGTHEQLAERCETYARLWSAQDRQALQATLRVQRRAGAELHAL
jgi:ABC-type multidrug transport system fused ATPase/permease subunit